MLFVKTLSPSAIIPTVVHPGEDLAFDLYSDMEATIGPSQTVKIQTGIAAQYVANTSHKKFGLLIRDRSGMAAKQLIISGGVIDSTYTGEIIVVMTNLGGVPYKISIGDKIAQMIPMPVFTGCGIVKVDSFDNNSRGDNGFGSSGR